MKQITFYRNNKDYKRVTWTSGGQWSFNKLDNLDETD